MLKDLPKVLAELDKKRDGILFVLADGPEREPVEVPQDMERESFMLTHEQAKRLQREVKELRQTKAELLARIESLVRQNQELLAGR